MKISSKWLGFWGILAAALITGIFMLLQKPGTTQTNNTTQKNDSGTNNSSARDINQSGRDVIQGKQVTVNNYADSNNSTNKRSSDNMYNVTSNNQQGGITAGKVILIKHAIIIDNNRSKENTDIKDNFICEIDTVKKIISVRPKVGSWANTFLGLPLKERDVVLPHFSNSNGRIDAMGKFSYKLQADSIYAMTTQANPATKDFYYTLQYRVLPSTIFFGNYPQPLYKTDLSFIMR